MNEFEDDEADPLAFWRGLIRWGIPGGLLCWALICLAIYAAIT